MAVSRIEERFLGSIAQQLAPANALVAASLFTVLGLSIQLSRRLARAKKLRELEPTRETPSLTLVHHIVWLAQEGLSITEARILPYAQTSDYGPEYRVMAAKLQASLRHVLCKFDSISTPSPKGKQPQGPSPKQGSPTEGANGGVRRRYNKTPLRDPVPSWISDTSFVTNPFATAPSPAPPLPTEQLPSIIDPRRSTPVHPPGLRPTNIAANIAAATFLLSDDDKVPATKGYFNQAQHLADTLLPPTHGLRLCVALEHAAFLQECTKDHDRARKLAKRTIREVYASSDNLSDQQFHDAAALVQALGGIVKRGPAGSNISPSSSTHEGTSSPGPAERRLPIDRAIALSPTHSRNLPQSYPPVSASSHARNKSMRSPGRLSTVPEVDSVAGETRSPSIASATPSAAARQQPASRLPQRRRASSSASTTASAPDKATKRKIVEQAEEAVRRRKSSSRGSLSAAVALSVASTTGSPVQPHSRQATPPEGYVHGPVNGGTSFGNG